MSTILQAIDLTKQVASSEGTLTILDGVRFSVESGEAVAIVGASGSGKSTLLGLLAGLDLPTRGHVRVDDRNLSRLDEDGRALLRARQIGFVFQNFQLLPGLTAVENVMLPLELAGQARTREPAEELLRKVGLGARLGHYPHQLSGGEQQRVAIARAFVTRPRLLLADEPTGNLDTRTGARVIEMLFELNAESRTTLVMVTHDPALAAHCERQLELDAGRLTA